MNDNVAGTGTSTLGAVEIVTDGYDIIGTCRGLNERLRLIDLLKNPEVTHLQLADAKVRHLQSAAEIVDGAGPFFIDKGSVIVGRSLASPEEEARRDDMHRFDDVEKAEQRMLVFAPPFRVVGDIHIIKDADLTIVLPKLFEGFQGMTGAAVSGEGENSLHWDSGFVVVNGRHIDMVCVVPPGYQIGLAGAGLSRDRVERAADETPAPPATIS